MVDAEKVKIMTKLAVFEQKEKRKALQVTQFYQGDYVRMKMLKAFVCVTIGYGILLLFWVLGQLDYLIQNAIGLDYEALLKKIAGGYGVLLILYMTGALIGSIVHYRAARRKVKQYDGELHNLRKWYRDQEMDSE